MDESIEAPVTFPSLNKNPLKDPCYSDAIQIMNGLKKEGMDALEIGKVVNFLVMLSRKNIETEALLECKPAVQKPAMLEGLDLKQRLMLDSCIKLSKFTAIEAIHDVREEHGRHFGSRESIHMVRYLPFVRRVGTLNGQAAFVLSPETIKSVIAGARL
ncbi:MAG: hypothetical protein SA339_11960 [Methanomassiliicoccus sp.]|nr:hypothetical protein [Methanomassiliicoccus sp.]